MSASEEIPTEMGIYSVMSESALQSPRAFGSHNYKQVSIDFNITNKHFSNIWKGFAIPHTKTKFFLKKLWKQIWILCILSAF